MHSYLINDHYQQLSIKSHPDIFIVDETSGYSVKYIRDLVRWTYNKPYNRNYKLVFIKNADRLNTESQNTLLKTLEEPPGQTYMFLTTRMPGKILPTVKSRCANLQLVGFQKNYLEIENPPVFASDLVILDKPISSFIPPVINSEQDALYKSEELAKMDREKLKNYLNDWIDYIYENSPEDYKKTNVLVDALEHLSHNTNQQLTLDVILLKMAEKSL